MTISVIVPTFRRVPDLSRCLASLQKQSRPADQVLLTVRDIDQETRAFLGSFDAAGLNLRVVDVAAPGVIAAMNAALAVASGDIIALTDDDGAPWPDWLGKIEGYFTSDATLGALGGRDWQYKQGKFDDGAEARCGEMQWWGRVTGMHHHAAPGPPREVVVIKGVNSAYRAAALKPIGFDTRLAGTGAQVHWELSLGLALKRAGWKILFDPAIAVDHFPAARFDEDQRGIFSGAAPGNAVANETLVLFEHFKGLQRWVFVLWAFLVGTRASPGLAQLPRLLMKRTPRVGALWLATQIGRCRGVSMYRPPIERSAGPLDRP
jgi:GT2 family glycosyltransferase